MFQDPYGNARQWQKLPAAAMKSYVISTPQETHQKVVDCAEYGCSNHLNGWRTPADESTPEGARIASEVRRLARPVGAVLSPAVASRVRRYIESKSPEGVTWFDFPPGEECFQQHRVLNGRPELFVVRGGDFRGNPRGTPAFVHHNATDWVDDCASHQATIAEAVEKG